MKIGEEILVHGYIDEIRDDIVIIKNSGGYFGTPIKEITKMKDYKTILDVEKGLTLFKNIMFDKDTQDKFIRDCKELGILDDEDINGDN